MEKGCIDRKEDGELPGMGVAVDTRVVDGSL